MDLAQLITSKTAADAVDAFRSECTDVIAFSTMVTVNAMVYAGVSTEFKVNLLAEVPLRSASTVFCQ